MSLKLMPRQAQPPQRRPQCNPRMSRSLVRPRVLSCSPAPAKHDRNRPRHPPVSLAVDMLTAAPSAALASVVLNPIELAKTRLQLQQRPGPLSGPLSNAVGRANGVASWWGFRRPPNTSGSAPSSAGVTRAASVAAAAVPGAAGPTAPAASARVAPTFGPVPGGVREALVGIARYEGVGALQHGLTSFAAMMSALWLIKLGMYRPAQRAVERTLVSTGRAEPRYASAPGASDGEPMVVVGAELSVGARISVDALCATLTGSTAGVVINPFVVVKTRMQTGTATTQSLLGELRVLGAAGVREATAAGATGPRRLLGCLAPLFKGAGANAARISIGNTSHLVSYDWAKRRICAAIAAARARVDEAAVDGAGAAGPRPALQPVPWYTTLLAGVDPESSLVHFVGSAASTVVIATTASPSDAIIARLHSAPSGTYSGAVDCVRKVVRAEGPGALFRAWPTMFIRIFPAATLVTTLWERLRLLAAEATTTL